MVDEGLLVRVMAVSDGFVRVRPVRKHDAEDWLVGEEPTGATVGAGSDSPVTG